MTNCPHCKSDVQPLWKACPACGERLPEILNSAESAAELQQSWKACSTCGNELDSSTNFCSHCGASLTGRQEESEFGSLRFHSRWLILVFVLAFVAASINLYLSSAVLVTYIVFVVIRNKLSVRALVGQMPSVYNWWPLVLAGVGGLVFSVGATVVVMYPLAQLNSELFNDLLADISFSESPLSSFISLIILAPLIEETVFRGLFFSRLAKKWGMTKAMIVSSLVFGLLHLNPIGALVFGVTACVLYVRTKTLLVPIALHALNNSIVWALMFTGVDNTSPESLEQFAYQGLIAMTFGAPIIFTLLGRWWPPRGTPIPYDVNKRDQQP